MDKEEKEEKEKKEEKNEEGEEGIVLKRFNGSYLNTQERFYPK